MRPGRLFLRIYLACVIAYLSIGIGVVLFLQKDLWNSEWGFQPRLVMRDLLVRRGDARSLSAQVAWLRENSFPITVYDGQGSLIASTEEPPLPMVPAALLPRLQARGKVAFGASHIAYAESEAGHLAAVGVRVETKGIGRKIAERLLVWLLGYLLFAALFARYLVRPLQHLVRTARRFGRGELSARARLTRSDEIGEVGRAFDEMADRVNQLIAAQQELMANVSHELQTPLARIHVALEHIAVKGAAKATELLPEIEMDLAELQRLFDDVMTVARLDLSRTSEQAVQTPLRLEQVALEGLLHKVAGRFRVDHPSRTLVLDLQPGLPELCADAVLLRRAVENLAENARKYSAPASPIRIAAAVRAGAVTIEVADQGIGMSEDDVRRAFTPFFRSDRSRDRHTGGVGLGLALVRRVIEAHGGTVALTSALGQGTTATIQLPTERAGDRGA